MHVPLHAVAVAVATDHYYYTNSTALGPPPTPPAQCVPGPSECPPAPPGSIFPPPGDRPPGCNRKGCTTLPTLVPTWAPTYVMNESTLIMPCNTTGSTDPQSTKGWAYLDFDWSNWKGKGDADGWAKHKPMDCEELMVKQVQMTVAASPKTKVFVYRNMVKGMSRLRRFFPPRHRVLCCHRCTDYRPLTPTMYRGLCKALPWFTSVRKIITDPAYAPWFIKFSKQIIENHTKAHVPVCDKNYDPPLCSDYYHDQSQTPGYPHGDGDCAAPGCDVGTVPVGEYLFDHRNANVSVNGQTFIEWFIDDYFGGPAGIGNKDIIGFYIDDDWGNMNPNGPSEMEGHAMEDMGLGPDDLKAIVPAYNWVATTVYKSIVAQGKFSWDLFLNNDPNCINCGDCPQPWVKKATCKEDIRAYGVNATSPFVDRALLYGFSPGSCHGVDPANLTEVRSSLCRAYALLGPFFQPMTSVHNVA